MAVKAEKVFKIEGIEPLLFYGVNDRNIKIIEDSFQVTIIGRGDNIKIIGDKTATRQVEELFKEIVFLVNKNKKINRKDLLTAIQVIKGEFTDNTIPENAKNELDSVVVFTEDGTIKPKSSGQIKFCNTIKNNDIVFCIGPAGTGKTYLAVALAVAQFKNKIVNKIVLTRPAVEAGESLGFLPGDFKEKIDPYLQPLYDALTDILPKDVLKKHIAQKNIEVVPLAYMRGRTLNNAFVLLDEAQNTSFLQMKMFLTRLGFNSKCIINGDITQIDLPDKSKSGLLSAQDILKGIKGIKFVNLTTDDVVRHVLVKKIINAYEESESNEKK